MKKLTLTIIILTIFTSINPTEQAEVGYAGALKNFMHKGDISAEFSLSEFVGKEHIYALGAVEKLKGEIQIFDSEPIISYAENGNVMFDNTLKKNASLIVYAQVSEWENIQIPESIITRNQFEEYIQKAAIDKSLDIEKPFSFLIEGKINYIDWHVIDWNINDPVHTHEKHMNSGLNGRITDAEVVVLGFYSNKHKTIFTHHTSNLHMHFKKNDNSLAGHIDDMDLGKNMILKLPVSN